MGFLLRFILTFVFIYLLIRGILNFLTFSSRYRRKNPYNHKQQNQRTKQNGQPETQEDRIIEYQKKSFESSDVEDADFVEIKDHDRS